MCVQGWPSTIRGVYGDQERYEQTYFAPYKGYYFSGDGARRDGVPHFVVPSYPYHAFLPLFEYNYEHTSRVSVPRRGPAERIAAPSHSPAVQLTGTTGSLGE